MSFGLKNAPATFQRIMDNVLKALSNTLVYLHDIIVFSASSQEHIVNLKAIFQRLGDHNLKVQLDKSEFLHKEVTFLIQSLQREIIPSEGIKPNPENIKAILNYTFLKLIEKSKSFLVS